MARRQTFIVAVWALLLCGAGPGLALADQRQDIGRKIKETEKSIIEGRIQQRALADQARTVGDQVQGLRIRAAVAAHKIQKTEAALNEIEDSLTTLQQQDDDYRRRLDRMQDSMAHSVAALIRMERRPAAALLAASGTMLDVARGGRLLAVALPALRADADQIGELLAAVGQVRVRLSQEQKQHIAAMTTLSGRRQELQELLREQAKSERQLRRASAAEGRRLAALAGKAGDLRNLMQRLKLEERARQEEQRRAAAQAAVPAGNAAAPDAGDAAGLAQRRRQKFAADMARALAGAQDGKEAEAGKQDTPTSRQRLALAPNKVPFSKIRGHLQLPAEGKLVGKFGDSTGFGPHAQGITLQTRKGAQVVVPYGGRVVFAGPFRNYGLILIISHGEGYHTLLAGLSTLQAVVGQALLTGEPVGRMGGDGKRSLYIELRRKGVAINPNPWWSNSRERASG